MTNAHPEPALTNVEDPGPLGIAAGLNPLTREECWARLATQRLGRIAFAQPGRVEIFPINYALGENAIVFRSASGTKLGNADGSLCAFEVDFYDEALASGWSVIVQGPLFSLTRAGAERVRRAGVAARSVAPGVKPFWLVIDVQEVSGRMFTDGVKVPNWV